MSKKLKDIHPNNYIAENESISSYWLRIFREELPANIEEIREEDNAKEDI